MPKFERVLSIYACSVLTLIAVLLVVVLAMLGGLSSRVTYLSFQTGQLSKDVQGQSDNLSRLVFATGADDPRNGPGHFHRPKAGIPVYIQLLDQPLKVEVR